MLNMVEYFLYMKVGSMKKSILISIAITIIVILILFVIYPIKKYEIDTTIFNSTNTVSINMYNIKYQDYLKKNFYAGESVEQITSKIERYLNFNLDGKGEFIVRYSIEVGVDPYLSTAIILHETGCESKCSYLARECNNYGGNKGKPGCNGGSYRKFSSAEEGLQYAINNLSGYIKKGLTTPEQINKKYAESTAWAGKVKKYMNKLKS